MSGIIDRREFLKHSLATATGAAIGACAASDSLAEPGGLKSRPDVIVHRGGYPGWPWVAPAGKDRLVCVFRDDGKHGFSPTGRAMFTSSSDAGKTWAPARAIADEQGVDDRNVAISQLPDGTLMACYNTYTKELISRSMAIRSKDGGATWSERVMIADLDARTRGAPIALSSGDILVPIYHAKRRNSIAALSSDGGKTWKLSFVPNMEHFVGNEWDVLEVAKGRVIGMCRNWDPGRDGYFWKTESRDGGRTWDTPRKTNVCSARAPSPPHIDMHGKTPLLTYADHRKVSVSMVTTADAEFVNWDLDSRLPCYQYRPDGKPIADASYPVSVAVGPGRRFIVDYEIRPEGKWIAGYFVDLPAAWR